MSNTVKKPNVADARRYWVEGKLLSDIGDTIREFRGTEVGIELQDIPDEIRKVHEAGYEKGASKGGYAEGYNEGYSQGYEAGYSTGKAEGGGGGGNEGYDEGYDEGYTAGEEAGYEKGKTEGYADGYAKGYADGYATGKSEGRTEGYEDGYEVGKTDGRTEGYTEGKADGVAEGIETGYATGKAEGITEGIATGKAEGIEIGRAEGLAEGYENGETAANNAFWNGFTNNGNRTDYYACFYNWGNEYIRPTRKIIPKTAGSMGQMFNNCKNLKKIEAECFDFSQKPIGTKASEGYYYTFATCTKLEEIEDIGMQAEFAYNNAFSTCYALHTIAKIRSKEETLFSNTFSGSDKIQNISFEGVIGQDLNIRWTTKLTADSIRSIITHLSDTASGKTLTLSTTARKNAFTDTEWATLIATKSNWTISLQ